MAIEKGIYSAPEGVSEEENGEELEIEIVDPDLSPGWNMERGERKVIYLKD